MKCYKVGACGLYGIISCHECPANNSDYPDVEKAQAEILKMVIKNYNELKTTYDELVQELEEAKKDLSIPCHCVTCKYDCSLAEAMERRNGGKCPHYEWRAER